MNNIPKGVQKQGYLTWDIGLLAEAMQITPEDVYAYFTDGRRVSFISIRTSQTLANRSSKQKRTSP